MGRLTNALRAFAMPPEIGAQYGYGPSSSVGANDGWFIRMLGGGPTKAGVQVSESNALYSPTVFACVNRIANPIANFPVGIVQPDGKGGWTRVDEHPMSQRLGLRPNDFMSSRTLNGRSKEAALTKMFGTDGMRVALALMQAGAKGIADMQRQIESVTAQQKLDILLEGEAAATQRLASAWEKLKIVVGEAGIIQAFTMVKETAAGVLTVVGGAPPWFYKLAVAAGLAAASIGPLTIAAVGLAKIALPLLALRLGPIALGVAAIINPTGVLIRLLGQLALQAGAATLIGRLGTALIGVAGPIGLAVTAASLLIPMIMRLGQVSAAYADQQAKLNEDQARGRDVTMQLATATGQARDEALNAAKALRVQRIEALATAKAMLLAARANYQKQRQYEQSGAASGTIGTVMSLITGRNRTGAARDLVAANQVYQDRLAGISELDGAIAAAGRGSAPKIDMSFDDEKKKRTKKGRDTSADDEDYAAKLAEVRNAQLQAQADLTGSYEARYRADMDGLVSERATYAKQLATDERLTPAAMLVGDLCIVPGEAGLDAIAISAGGALLMYHQDAEGLANVKEALPSVTAAWRL